MTAPAGARGDGPAQAPTPAPYSLSRRMRTAAVAAVTVVLVVTLGSVVRLVAQHTYLEPRVEGALRGSHGVAAAHAAMLDQETGVRGYLLTGDRRFLEPYLRGQEEFLEGMSRVGGELPHEGEVRPAFEQTQSAAMLWMTRYAGPATADGADTGPPPELGKELFDDYRAAQADLVARSEDHALGLLRAQRRWSDLLTAAELLLGGALATALLLRARRLRTELFAPLREIDEVAAALSQGRLDAPVRLAGTPPRELQDAAARLEVLRTRLVRQERQLGAERLATTRRSQLHQQVLRHSADLSSESDVQLTCTAVVESASRLSGAPDVSLWVAEGEPLRLAAHVGGDGVLDATAERLVHSARRFGREEADVQGDCDMLALPLVAAGRTAAVLLLRDLPTAGDGPDRLDAVRSLAAHAAAALAAAQLHQEALTASLRDELTGLWNRRRFNEDLPREAGLAARHGHPVSLLMLDLDRFKSYNDTHGHPAGDALLRQVAALLSQTLRDGDAAYRLGGEEFAVLLSHDDEGHARACGERLRSVVQTGLRRHGVTVSVGVAALEPDGTNGETEALVRRADEALYLAKNSGRNRVVAASDDVPALEPDGQPSPVDGALAGAPA